MTEDFRHEQLGRPGSGSGPAAAQVHKQCRGRSDPGHMDCGIPAWEYAVRMIMSRNKGVFLGLASQAVPVVKNLFANAQDLRDAGSIPGLGRSPGEGHGNTLQCS